MGVLGDKVFYPSDDSSYLNGSIGFVYDCAVADESVFNYRFSFDIGYEWFKMGYWDDISQISAGAPGPHTYRF
ncbi:MAG: hypothetical protein GY754_01600 [bacterium]|nr:hypothetical protein [bacterium]